MPSFVNSPKKEKQWSDAKKAASKTLSESKDGDAFWKLTNSIYQKMSKALEVIEELEKARPKMSDEYDVNDDPYSSDQDDNEYEDLQEIDPEGDNASDWLKENDPSYSEDLQEEHKNGNFEEAEEDEEGSTAPINQDVRSTQFRQPSKEELLSLRQYTRPWEQRAREATKVQADPKKNPELYQQGKIIEARNTAHGDKKAAYQKFTMSPEYKNADPITQMEMDDKFEADWKQNNPEHLINAMNAHHDAHINSLSADDAHKKAKEEKIQTIVHGGTHDPNAVSTEVGLQHAGGAKGEEGTEGSIKQDPATAFAMGNQEFVKQFAQQYNQKAKKPTSTEDLENYDESSKKDLSRILGPGPAKDPKFEQFFAHFFPLIGMNAKKTISKLGLDPKNPEIDHGLLHEAGMHGLIQAVNDYDHDHPSKASFATHASNKIRGLQLTAMKNQDAIPQEVRQAHKKFMQEQKGQQPKAAVAQTQEQQKPKAHQTIKNSNHPASQDIADRLKRISAARSTQTIRRTGAAAQPKKLTEAISIPKSEIPDEGEE